jgi:hypothetical protein
VLSKGGTCAEGCNPIKMVIPCLLGFLGQLGCHSASDDPSATPGRTLDKPDSPSPTLVRPMDQADGFSPTSVRILYKGERTTLKFCVAGSSGITYGLPGALGEKETQGGIGLEWTFGGSRRN